MKGENSSKYGQNQEMDRLFNQVYHHESGQNRDSVKQPFADGMTQDDDNVIFKIKFIK